MFLSACGGKGNTEEPIINTSEPTNTENTTQDEAKTDCDVSVENINYAGTVLNGTYHNEYFDFSFTPESDLKNLVGLV